MGQGLRTDGQVHAHQIKSLDWALRRASLVERAPDVVVQEVLMCLQSVFAD
jgi:mRNA interferase ChpB